MALRIVFESGPDQGREFVIVGEIEVRIGRGPGYHIVPRDRNWKGGLRVEYVKGVYRITNEMAHAILRDGTQEFPQNTEEIWYNNATVQPTAETVLRCHHIDDPEGQAEPVVETTQTKEWWDSSKLMQILIIVVCLPTAAVLFLSPTGDPSQEEGTSTASPNELRQGLLKLAAAKPGVKQQAESLAEQLRLAWRDDTIARRPREAYEQYLLIRSELDGLETTNPLRGDPVVKELNSFVQDRISALGRRHGFARNKK